MVTAREKIVRFLESEGHRVEVSDVADTPELTEIVFRTRGQTFSVAVSEMEPQRLSVSTAYEVPDVLGVRSHSLDALADVEADFPDVRVTLAHDDTIFVATVEYETEPGEAEMALFWHVVGRLRDAGTSAIEHMVDRSQSKAAADKFIRQFMKGDRP